MSDQGLRAPKGAVKKRKRVGRGAGSGKGGRCGRGDNGQNSRSGGGVRLGFEGGQMPLYRRIARRGFSNSRFRKDYAVVNLQDLEKKYSDGETVEPANLRERGLIGKKGIPVKLLGKGELSKKLVIQLDRVSRSARDAVIKAGGEVVDRDGMRKDPKAEEAKVEGEKAGTKAAVAGKAAKPEGEQKEAANKEVNDENNGK